MADKNFIVKNGLEVGGQEVVSSSGVVTSAALGGQTLASTDSPTFANLTVSNDLAVSGDLNLTGDLNITGDVNSLSVTDLDVTDQTITLGAGQVESASGGSGIVVDGSGASILWDETNTEFDINNPLHITTAAATTAHFTAEETSGATTSLRAGGSVGYVGTYSNHPLRVVANSGTKIYVATDGKIGIGSNHTNPLQTVDISGNAAGLNLQGGNNRIYFSNYRAIEGATDASLLQVGEGFTDIALQGNVGIGAVSPNSQLEILNSSTAGNTQLHIHNNKAGDAAVLKLEGARTGSANDCGQVLFANSGNIVARIDAKSSGDEGQLRFFTSATGTGSSVVQAMHIDTGGNVGIGTDNPDSILHVTGNSDNGDGACQLIINDEDSDEGSRVPSIQFRGNGTNTTRMRGTPSGFYLSSSSSMNDDFIVKSDGLIGMGISPTTRLHIKGTGDMIRLESTNSGAGGAQIDMLHFSPSGANEDTMAALNFGGYYSGSASAYFGAIRCIATDLSGRHGRLEFITRDDAAFNTGLTIDHQPCVGIGTTTPVAKLDVIGHNPNTAPSVYDYLYANGSGIRVRGEEAGIDLVGLDDGGHSSSVLFRNTNQGFGIFNVPNDDTLRIRSFDAQAQNFYIHSGGGNIANLVDVLALKKTSEMHVGANDSDTRIYIGSSGGEFGGNSSNWVRGSGSTLMYNCGGSSASHIWETAGTQRLQLTNAYLEHKTDQTDQYTLRSRNTASGDPGLSLTRDNVVGFGIAVRGATNDYVDFQINNQGATSFGESGKLRLYHNNEVAMPGNHVFNTDDGWYFYSSTGRVFQTFNYNSAGAEVFLQNNRTASGTVAAFQYRINNSAQSGGTIYASTSGYTGGNFSDYRLKNNVTNLTGSLDKITQLRAVSYNHVNTPDKTELGFIAHEINDVFPEFVHGEKDAVWTQEDIDNYEGQLPDVEVGDIKAQQVDYFSKEWTTHILHAIKELKAENDSLKARIEALEG